MDSTPHFRARGLTMVSVASMVLKVPEYGRMVTSGPSVAKNPSGWRRRLDARGNPDIATSNGLNMLDVREHVTLRPDGAAPHSTRPKWTNDGPPIVVQMFGARQTRHKA